MNKKNVLLLRGLHIAFWAGCFTLILIFLKIFPSLSFQPTLRVLAWADMFDQEFIAQFEQKHGVRVVLNAYDSNDELIVKLKATRGQGYDLIVASDYALDALHKNNLLLPIDHAQLPCLAEQNPVLLNLPFDPGNKYSVPFGWDLFGIGIDRDAFFEKPEASWKLIFDVPTFDKNYRIVMVNDALEAILFSAHYLYGPVQQLTDDQIEDVKNLLLLQKPFVEAYADYRSAYFLATRQCQATVVAASYLYRIKDRFSHIEFLVPEEGTFIAVENLVIPNGAQHIPYVYELMNFLCSKESYIHHYPLFNLLPARVDSISEVVTDPLLQKLSLPTDQEFARYSFFVPALSDQKKFDLWVALK